MQPVFSVCERRPVRFMELWDVAGWRIKVYCIAHGQPTPGSQLLNAGRSVAEGLLRGRSTANTHYGVGFLGIHDGRGENQVFLDRWVNENELLHDFWVSPKSDPASLTRPGNDHNSVCVWDLAVQCFEREAWLATVLRNPAGPDLEAYLASRLSADV